MKHARHRGAVPVQSGKQVSDMSEVELRQQFLYYSNSIDQALGVWETKKDTTQSLYDCYANMDQFLHEVDEVNQDLYEQQHWYTALDKYEDQRRGLLARYGQDIKVNDDVENRYQEVLEQAQAVHKTRVLQRDASAVHQHTAVRIPSTASSRDSSRDTEERFDGESSVSSRSGKVAPPPSTTFTPQHAREEEERHSARKEAEGMSVVEQWNQGVAQHSQTTEEKEASLYEGSDKVSSVYLDEQRPREYRSAERGVASSNLIDLRIPVQIFAIKGQGKNYIESSMRDFLASKYSDRAAPGFFMDMPPVELSSHLNNHHDEVVAAIDTQITADYHSGALTALDPHPDPTTQNVSTYNFKGKTLTQTGDPDAPDGMISFDAQEGLNAVVRIQRRERGVLIEAYDTIEYKNGQVAALIVGKGGESRLAQLSSMRSAVKSKSGIDVGGLDSEEDLHQAKHFAAEESRDTVQRKAAATAASLVDEEALRGATSQSASARGGDRQDARKRMQESVDEFSVHKRATAVLNAEDAEDVAVHRSPQNTPSVGSSSSRRRR